MDLQRDRPALDIETSHLKRYLDPLRLPLRLDSPAYVGRSASWPTVVVGSVRAPDFGRPPSSVAATTISAPGCCLSTHLVLVLADYLPTTTMMTTTIGRVGSVAESLDELIRRENTGSVSGGIVI